MELFQKEFIGLIHAAFSDKQMVLSPNFDWKKAVSLARKHNIAPIIFYGATNCNIPLECEHMQILRDLTHKSLNISLRQMYEIQKIEDAFEQKNIEYMPLKGAVLKTIYPKPEMRTMGDADLLIKLDQYQEIQTIMRQLGFEFQYESDHELVWKNPSLFLELHKRVMTSYNKDYYGYFGSGWKFANRVSTSCKYQMSPEDFYIYTFVHFAKHYRISGIGINHLLDIWVLSQYYSDLNWEYISGVLKKINLHKFHLNVIKTIHVWFHEETETDETDLITNMIFNSGQYGSADMAMVNRALRSNNGSASKIRLLSFFRRVFLPYQEMKKKYGILKQAPFLLPILWAIRCFHIVFLRNDILKRYVKNMKLLNSKNVSENAQALHFVGLDFNGET